MSTWLFFYEASGLQPWFSLQPTGRFELLRDFGAEIIAQKKAALVVGPNKLWDPDLLLVCDKLGNTCRKPHIVEAAKLLLLRMMSLRNAGVSLKISK